MARCATRSASAGSSRELAAKPQAPSAITRTPKPTLVSSLIDTWLVLRDVEAGGERNRGLYVIKSRGMQHSNQIREFLITSNGIDLLDVYAGPDGVLTGSLRASQEARDRAASVAREQEQQRRLRALATRRAMLQAQIDALQREAGTLEAEVAYVSPTLDPGTRTARVRLELPNPGLALRPAMYASVSIAVDHGERLVVPLSAVLRAGQRSFVFRALGDGRFRPQPVTLGLRSGEQVEVVEGLAAGDPIVASGTFLIASESRLRAALERW